LKISWFDQMIVITIEGVNWRQSDSKAYGTVPLAKRGLFFIIFVNLSLVFGHSRGFSKIFSPMQGEELRLGRYIGR
jgi:hypothetical protein